ncbi:MAG TPA: serine/threonine-protein kinase, partial [Acidothermaceae bacterium]
MSFKQDRTTPPGPAPPGRSAAGTPVTSDTLKTSQVVAAKRPPPLEPGVILDRRYAIEACVGEGGSGFVFRAFDRTLAQRIALKVLHPDLAADKSWIKRLKREVRVAREIQHPNVCRVFDLGHADGHWFVTMEYATDGSLRQVLDARSAMFRPLKKLPIAGLAARFADAQAVCAGLAAIHSVGIVHRDITPGNVLRMNDGRLVITDFGLAISAKDVTTFHGGTPKYMAPELLERKPADQRSDVWQLGYLLHEIIFQRHPDWTHIGDRVVLRSPAHELSTPTERAIAELCIQCLSHNPDGRPKDAIQVAGRVAAAEHARPLPPLSRLYQAVRRFVGRRVIRRGAVVLVAAACVWIGTRSLFHPSSPDRLLLRAAALWNSEEEDRARRPFVTVLSSRPLAVDTFHRVSASIRDHLHNWTFAYGVARKRTGTGTGPDMQCLEDDLDSVAGVVTLLQSDHAKETLVDGAPYAVAALRDPRRCLSSSRPTIVLPRPPPGTALRAQVDHLRRALMFANPLMEGEHFAVAPAVIQPLVSAAKATGYRPLIAEALLAEAHAAGRAMTTDATYRARLEDALWEAERCGHDRIVAISAAELAFADRFSTDTAITSKWLRMADSVLDRIGGDSAIQSWLENNRGIAAHSRGRFADAIAAYQKALELKRAEVGPDHLEYAIRLLNLSEAFQGANRLQDALHANDAAIRLMTSWLGPDHIDIGIAKNNRADILMALNRVDEAVHTYEAALDIFRQKLSAQDPRLGFPLLGLGTALLQQGDHHRARLTLQQASAFDFTGDQFVVSDVKFALARALVADGADHE